MKTHQNGIFAILLILLGIGLNSCSEADVSVTGMEVTQAIQNSSNSVPLVAGRSTAVRVFLDTDGSSPVGPVTGRLTVTVDGVAITPAGGLQELELVNAQPTTDKNIEDHTLNFELPAPSGIGQSTNVDFEVVIDYVRDTDGSNNDFQLNNLTFTELENPNLFYSSVDYTPLGLGAPDPTFITDGVGDAMVEGIYPVLDSDPDLYDPATIPAFGFASDLNGNDSIDTGSETDLLLAILDVNRSLMVISGFPASYTYNYGWLAGDPMSGFAGVAPLGGFVGFGNTTPDRFQRSYAHELGHNFGQGHNNRILSPDVGWDTDARLAYNPTSNNTTGRVKPNPYVDVMNSGPPTESTWIDVGTYSAFFTRMVIQTVLPSPSVASASRTFAPSAPSSKLIETNGFLVLQGGFNAEGTELNLFPTLRHNAKAKLPAFQENGRFMAVVTTKNGQKRRYPFDALVCYEGAGPLRNGYFQMLLPMEPQLELQSVEVFETENRRKMGEWLASEKPNLTINSPAKGATLKENVKVSWQGNDPEGKKLSYHLAYSPDGGKNWHAVSSHFVADSFSFGSELLPPTKDGQGILRVYACDGLNTVYQQVDNLSLSPKP